MTEIDIMIHYGGSFQKNQDKDERKIVSLFLRSLGSERSLIEEEKLDSMNMPRYGATPEEVIQVIESKGFFTLQKLEAINNPLDEGLNKNNGNDDIDISVDFIAKHVRATCEPMIKEEFGEWIIDELFLKYKRGL
ncbi:hypothetical protein AHAS_Ahas16G0212300 [Arachis hypogaea]